MPKALRLTDRTLHKIANLISEEPKDVQAWMEHTSVGRLRPYYIDLEDQATEEMPWLIMSDATFKENWKFLDEEDLDPTQLQTVTQQIP